MRPRPLGTAAIAVGLLAAIASFASARQLPESTPVPVWGPDGTVRSLARTGDTLVIGGAFTTIGPATGGMAIVDAADSTAVTTTDLGTVNLLAADGAGGWYAAQWRGPAQGPTVLRVTEAGHRHPAWVAPTFDGDNIYGLAVDGGRVFVAGQFGKVNGETRWYLVALDGVTGAVLPWTPTLRSGLPLFNLPRIAAANGRLHLSLLDVIGGVNQPDVIAVDTSSGALLPFQVPALADGHEYRWITMAGSRPIMSGVGCGATGREGVCAFDASGQARWAWAPPEGQRLWALWSRGDRVYVGLRDPNAVLAFDAATGALLPWSIPGPTLVGSLVDDGTTVYAATIPNSGARGDLLAFDRGTAAPLAWRPVVGGAPLVIDAAAGRVAMGGQFRTAGGVERRNLAALDLRSGRAVHPLPDVAGPVNALAVVGDIGVAAVGGGAPEIFAFSVSTGARINWRLVPNGQPLSLLVAGDALYIGGLFSELSGQARGSLAAVSLATASLLPWNPNPGFEVSELIASDTTVYAAGTDYSFGGKRARGAAFDVRSRARLSFDPPLDWISGVRHLATSAGRVISTGRYWGPPRSFGVSFLHPEHGHLQGNLSLPFPTTIAAGGRDMFFVGGYNDTGSSTGRLAAFDARTGALLPWDIATAYGEFTAMLSTPDLVAVGGRFDVVAGAPASNLTVFRAARPIAPRRLTLSVVGSTATLGWQSSPGATGSIVEAGTTPGGTEFGRFAVGTATAASGTLGAGTYFARVRGVSEAGEGGASSEAIFSLPATALPPGTPGPLTANVAAGVVTLSWGAAANATSYVLDVGSQSGASNIGSLPTGHLDTTFVTPAPSGVYFVRVRAVNAHGSSAATNEVQVVVP